MPKLHLPTIKLLVVSLLVFWIPVVLLFSIANEVLERQPLPGDVPILDAIHRTLSANYSGFFLFWTTIGSAPYIAGATALLLGLLWYLKRRRAMLIVLFGVAGAAAANVVLKLAFRRQRPSLWQSIVQEHSFSFPSGHAMASSALVFCLIAITWRTRWRWPVAVGGLVFMIFVGFSRLYFGVHYPSDVVAGWLASFAWVTLVVYVVNRPSLETRLKHVTDKVSFLRAK